MNEMIDHEYTDKLETDPHGCELWLTLFMIADKHDPELAHKLEYLRGCGTVLAPSRKFGYILQPVIGENGWPDREAYDREKQCLNPHVQDLLKILRRLAEFEND